jgi:hypothetical protein
MKKITVIVFSILLLSFGCKTNKPAAETRPAMGKSPAMEASAKYSDQTTWVLGYFNRDRLTSPPHSEWFLKGYDEYQFNSEAVNKLFDISKDNITIKKKAAIMKSVRFLSQAAFKSWKKNHS